MTRPARNLQSIADLLKQEIKQTSDDNRCHRSCDHHMYNGRNLKCLRPADHKLRAEEEGAIMADSHVDYVMIDDRTDLISFGEDCCEGEPNVG